MNWLYPLNRPFSKKPTILFAVPPKFCKSIVFNIISLGLTIEKNAYANLCRANKEHYGIFDKKAYS